MTGFFEFFGGRAHRSSARVVDGSLVLSLPDAATPAVMRLSLEEVKQAALEVIEQDGTYVLTLRTSAKESRDIAPFAQREVAVEALMAASRALERGSRQALPANDAGAAGEAQGGGSLKWVGAFCVLALLVWVVWSSATGPNIPRAPFDADTNPSSVISAGSVDPNATGVPMSADQFLSRQR